jgi:hypothetical protein
MTKNRGEPPEFAQAVMPELTNLGSGESTCSREHWELHQCHDLLSPGGCPVLAEHRC